MKPKNKKGKKPYKKTAQKKPKKQNNKVAVKSNKTTQNDNPYKMFDTQIYNNSSKSFNTKIYNPSNKQNSMQKAKINKAPKAKKVKEKKKKSKFSQKHPKLSLTIKIGIVVILALTVIAAGIVVGILYGMWGQDFEISEEELKEKETEKYAHRRWRRGLQHDPFRVCKL